MSVGITWDGDQMKSRVRSRVEQGVMEGNVALHAMAVSRAPKLSGDLRGRSRAVGEWVGQYRFLAITSFSMIYATRQHEETGWRHTNGQAKYLSSAQADLQGFIKNTIENHLRGALS